MYRLKLMIFELLVIRVEIHPFRPSIYMRTTKPDELETA